MDTPSSFFSALLPLLILVLLSTSSFSSPLLAPDIRLCSETLATSPNPSDPTNMTKDCCLPWHNRPTVDFSWDLYPAPSTPRVRRPAHKADADYIQKINRAYQLMKSLPHDDPRSFDVQAKIHCAFCNGAFKQLHTNITLQVHFSWFFLPWHRLYLYFHERILASLLGDPSFTLVYWNWDNQLFPPNNDSNLLPNNMPRFFTVKDSPIYDARRNADNDDPDQLVRLNVVSNLTLTDTQDEIRHENLNMLYQALVTADTADTFMGGPYRQGTNLAGASVVNAPLGGSLELNLHSGVHYWTGDPNQKLRSDMGVFTTAAQDPIFFAHHSNVDRLWEVWRTLPGGCRKEPTDTDFLDAEFLFYDEHGNLVKVKAREALETEKMGVTYEQETEGDKLWQNFDPVAAAGNEGSQVEAAKKLGAKEIGSSVGSNTNATIELGTAYTALVRMPGVYNSSADDLMLVIEGMEMSPADYVLVKVFVNMPKATWTTRIYTAEYAGGANFVPSPDEGKRVFTNLELEIGDNVERLGLGSEEWIAVTVLVNSPASAVTIRGMRMDLQDRSSSSSFRACSPRLLSLPDATGTGYSGRFSHLIWNLSFLLLSYLPISSIFDINNYLEK